MIDPLTGENRTPAEIFASLKDLVATTSELGPGLGILTAENRDKWSDAYETLCRVEVNRANFASIHNSLFVLCLDNRNVKKPVGTDERSLAVGQILHGEKEFTANRWFDKTIQVIVAPEGIAGSNFEHSVAEAVPHALMNDYIAKYM